MKFASQQAYEDFVKKYGVAAAAGGNSGVKKDLLEGSAPQPAAPKQTAAQERLAKVKAEAKAKQDAAKAKQQAAVQAMKQRAADRAAAAARTKQERQDAAKAKLQQAKKPAVTPAPSPRGTGPNDAGTNPTTSPIPRGTSTYTGTYQIDKGTGSGGGSKVIDGQTVITLPGGMKKGGEVKESAMMKKEGRGMAKANMQKIASKAVKGHEQRMHKMASNGSVSKRADGCAQRGKTKGRMV